jgi:hypothetical protein
MQNLYFILEINANGNVETIQASENFFLVKYMIRELF